MDSANSSAPTSADIRTPEERELVRRYCSDPPDKEAGEKSRRCLPKLHEFVRQQVFGKGVCPPGHSPQVFFDDCFSTATENFSRGIRSYAGRGTLDAWLNRLAINTVMDEWRKAVGRGEEPNPIPVPIDVKGGKNEETLQPNAIFVSKYWVDPSALVRNRELEHIFKVLITIHASSSRHGRRSSHAIVYRCRDELEDKEVATLMRCSARTVQRLLSEDFESLRDLFESEFGVTDADQL